jgi:F-type H+-transporting ATPase subunit epsilon
MAEVLELEIATAERLLVREHVTEAQIPAANGYIGVLPGHAPLLSELGTGVLSYVSERRRRALAVSGGWIEVLGDSVRVLASAAEKADEIDVHRAEEALKRARSRLERSDPTLDIARALNAMKRAQARLEAAQKG